MPLASTFGIYFLAHVRFCNTCIYANFFILYIAKLWSLLHNRALTPSTQTLFRRIWQADLFSLPVGWTNIEMLQGSMFHSRIARLGLHWHFSCIVGEIDVGTDVAIYVTRISLKLPQQSPITAVPWSCNVTLSYSLGTQLRKLDPPVIKLVTSLSLWSAHAYLESSSFLFRLLQLLGGWDQKEKNRWSLEM